MQTVHKLPIASFSSAVILNIMICALLISRKCTKMAANGTACLESLKSDGTK